MHHSVEGRVDTLALPGLEPRVVLPEDAGLPGFSPLFDNQWVWQTYCDRFGTPEVSPQGLRIQQLTYRPGRRALFSYMVEWPEDIWMPDDRFAIELVKGKPERVFQFPDDPHLPGLPQAVSPVEARDLMAKHVRIDTLRLRVKVVRYRPGSRAVLRYTAGRAMADLGRTTLFVRVMRPSRVTRFLKAAELAQCSGFVLPRLAGCWAKGGVVWLVRIPGETVRNLIRSGEAPEPDVILDHLERLWAGPVATDLAPRNMASGLRRTRDILAHLIEGQEARQTLQRVLDTLKPFVDEWKPTALAHNDFYDDQMLFTPDTGRLALVDFEETAPGDPLLDVGVMLAHLRRSARFGGPESCDTYRREFRAAALERFGWDQRELNLREAYSLFGLSANAFHSLHRNWYQTLETGLFLAAEALEL